MPMRTLIDSSTQGLVGTAASLAAALVIALPTASWAQADSDDPSRINGSWERYPSISSGLGSAADANAESIPAPPASIPAPPLKPEYLGEWQARRAEIQALTEQGLPPANNYSACIPEGMPAMMQAIFPMEVLETPGQITIIQEAYNQVRRIYLDEELVAPEDAEPRFAGHSVGQWEGDTLVVETVGVKDYVQFRDAPHSNKMRIVERIKLIAGGRFLENRVTVSDPEYLTAPWEWTWMYRRWPGYKIQEYVCEDNKYYEDPELGYQRLRVD